jgi:Lipoprotein LpqB beta-propeller domain/Sporulation and spore germination
MARPVWLRVGLLIAVVGSVAGCVGMPSNGPAAEFTATPQSTQQQNNFTGPLCPSGPAPNETPSEIVTGFLLASASYPIYCRAAGEYLTGSAARTWNPSSVTVYSTFDASSWGTEPPAVPHGASRAWVDITVTVQAMLTGPGQYISAQAQGGLSRAYPQFTLVKVDGQWRIQTSPQVRMVSGNDFSHYYKAQDLYFFDQGDSTLVPDSVFVPLGVSPQTLADNLVSALIARPTTPWLASAADSEFPPGTRLVGEGVIIDGATATVDLGGGAASATTAKRVLMAAQLVWTLTGSPASPSSIQSVVLEIDGKQFVPTSPPCIGGSGQGSFQTQAAYQCYNPYLSAPASFYYVDQQQSWSRCGAESAALNGSVGPAIPLVGRTGAFSAPQCGGGPYVSVTARGTPPAQPGSRRPLSMAAVSPDGKFLAIASPGKDALYVGALSGNAVSFPNSPRLKGAGITAMSWGTGDDLWVAQGGSIYLVRATGTGANLATFTGGDVSDLSVAPDGVRIAVIVSGGSVHELEVAAINQSGQPASGLRGVPQVRPSIGVGVPLGASLTDPIDLTWYGADNLVVLNQASSGNALWEVPVDGQPARGPLITPPGAISITADGSANVLVVGLSGTRLAVSAGLEGPWQTLGEQGQNPAYSR